SLVERLGEIPGVVDGGVFYGIFRQPGSGAGGEAGLYEYRVGTQVGPGSVPPDGMSRVTVPARTYAMATVRGSAEQIEATYLGVSRWREERGRQEAPDAYGLERYDAARQGVLPPYERFDYDVLRPLASAR